MALDGGKKLGMFLAVAQPHTRDGGATLRVFTLWCLDPLCSRQLEISMRKSVSRSAMPTTSTCMS